MEHSEHLSLFDQIRRLTRTEKILLAQRAERSERTVLAMEFDPEILFYLCKNPRITIEEIVRISKMSTVNAPVVDLMARNGSWIQSEELRMNLVLNPKTPLATALRLLPMLSDKNLKVLARNREMKDPIKKTALRLVLQRGN